MVTIKDLRESRFWTQAELAQMLDVTSQTVSNWERGASAPRDKQLRAIAELFDIDPGKIETPKSFIPQHELVTLTEDAETKAPYLSDIIQALPGTKDARAELRRVIDAVLAESDQRSDTEALQYLLHVVITVLDDKNAFEMLRESTSPQATEEMLKKLLDEVTQIRALLKKAPEVKIRDGRSDEP